MGSGDATKTGFAGKVHQLRANATVSTSVSTAEAQLAGQLIDAGTGLPYVNMVVTNGDPIIAAGWGGTQAAEAGGGPGDARTFTTTSVINYSIADGFSGVADAGNFTSANGSPDALFPGLPGSSDDTFTAYDNAVELAVELVGWIELPAGLQRIGVNCRDGFQLSISPNNAQDLFRTSLGQYELNREPTDSIATLFVETAGVYSFRLLFRSYRNSTPSQLEWFRYDESSGQPVLINDSVVGAVKSYRAVTVPTRPYVKSVTPAIGSSGVGSLDPISVVLVDLGTNMPALKVDGKAVSFNSVTNGIHVTLTHTPPAPLSGLVNCEVTYAGAVGQWTYNVRTGQKALFVVGSGGTPNTAEQFLGTRLAQKFGLDVQYQDVALMNADAETLSLASNKALIVVSATIPSGNIASWARNFMTTNLTVPVINWEFGNADEWGFSPSGGGGSSTTDLFITNAPNALTAELTNGIHTIYVSGQDGTRFGDPTPGVIVAATSPGDETQIRLAGMPEGLEIDNYANSGLTVTNASRKVHFGLIQNNSAHNLNANGLALFDAAIAWLLPPAPPAQPVLTATAGPGAGQITLGWTGNGTLETTSSLTAPNWVGAPSQANPQTLSTVDPQRYYRVKQ